MPRDHDQEERFQQWKDRAADVDLLYAATNKCGAKLKRAGREHVGPCPFCGGTDRFSVNTGKRKWNCRGYGGGGDAIGMLMHCLGLSFLEACEELTGDPPPKGEAKPISPQEREARERHLRQRQQEQRRREEEEQRAARRRAETAGEIAGELVPISGTPAEVYLRGRGIPVPPTGWPDVIGFHAGLEWELGSKWDGDRKVSPGPVFPCLVAKVVDAGGDLIAVWRIFLTPDGADKAPVANPKLGKGVATGGAVRLGGTASDIGVCEGLETGLAIWTLSGYRRPVWPALSTSGMQGLELPLEVERVRIYPDGDFPIRRQGQMYVPEKLPPGRKAALALKERCESVGVKGVIEPEPVCGTDYLDVLNSSKALEIFA